MTSMVVDDPSDLDSINARIHDNWFDLDTLVFDASRSLLEITFEQEHSERATISRSFLVKRVSLPLTRALLRVHFVESYQVKDEAKVGRYDFNRLIYQAESHELSVLTGVALELRIKVREFKVEVVDSEEVVAFKTARSLF